MKKYFLLFGLLLMVAGVKAQNPSSEFKLDFSSPTIFSGSTLPNFYQRLWINGDFDTMLKFTSTMSRKRFGDEKLRDYFNSMEFGYSFKLKSRKFEQDGTQTLNCQAQINATKEIIRFRCVVEGDTAKIIIGSISGNRFP